MKYIKKQIIVTATAVFIGSVNFAQTTIAFASLTTQAQVNDFSATVTEITGLLNIGGTDISNLDGLSRLEIVGGLLSIQNNPALASLSGLGALTSVGGNLIITNNDLLTSLDGLSGIESANNLTISENEKLINLSGLNNFVRADLLIGIYVNPVLTSLEGLDMLTSINQDLIIYSNAMLSTLNGLENLTSLGGEIIIGTTDRTVFAPNPVLINFCAIAQLVSGVSPIIAMNKYFVANNAYNPTHAQLGNSETCMNSTLTATLTLTTQTQIDNLAPHTKIDGDVTIKEATPGNITSLSGLTNITSITGNLAILENTALTSVEGLGNLAALGGQLQIGTTDGTAMNPNAALIDFCAISQLVTGTPPQVIIGEYFVANNGYNPSYAGLASTDAATTASETDGCRKFGTVVVSTNTFSKEEGYRLFPNPVSDVLFVKSESKITSITISNVSGQEVLKSNSESINVRNLSNGIYFARIVSGEKTVVEKFVKL